MCTAITYKTKDFYFGRTLDYEHRFGEEITITPRNFPLRFRREGVLSNHLAMIGMAHVAQNCPLYYDAVNEKGLGMAGLNFTGNAYYHENKTEKKNIAPFEFIPWILAQCASVREAKALLKDINLAYIPFNNELSISHLHWIIADSCEAITVESMKDGLHIHDNAIGILTNNPPFPEQLFQLNNYMNLSPKAPVNRFCPKLPLEAYSRGMGAMGLPGDLSSQSRFVRAAFVKLNSVSQSSEYESINQFFHILSSVEQQRGCCDVGDEKYEITLYTSCCNASKGIYYYTTYENHQISGIDMNRVNLDDACLFKYPLIQKEQIHMQN